MNRKSHVSLLGPAGLYCKITFVFLSIALAFQSSNALADQEPDTVFVCEQQDDWTRHAAIETYFRSHYHEIDLRNGAFLSKDRQYMNFARAPMSEEKSRLAKQYHERTLGMIKRLGLLLPHLSHPMDLPELMRQIDSGSLKHYPDDDNVQFLRAALAQDVLESDQFAKYDMQKYLENLQSMETLTADIQVEDFDADDAAELDKMAYVTWESHRRFLNFAKPIIFASDLHDRMSARLIERCADRQRKDSEKG